MSEIKSYDNYTYPVSNPETGAGHPGHTTPDEEAKVLQLRKELEEAGYTARLDTHTMVSSSLSFSILETPALINPTAPVPASPEVRCRASKAHVRTPRP